MAVVHDYLCIHCNIIDEYKLEDEEIKKTACEHCKKEGGLIKRLSMPMVSQAAVPDRVAKGRFNQIRDQQVLERMFKKNPFDKDIKKEKEKLKNKKGG